MLIVDDVLLFRVLAGTAEGEIASAAGRSEIFTTGSWYSRLNRALSSPQMEGALSRPFAAFAPERRGRVLAALDHLPDEIGLLSLRDLVPVIRAFDISRPLSLLTTEALAAGRVLDGEIRVTTESAMLWDGAAAVGVHVRLVAL